MPQLPLSSGERSSITRGSIRQCPKAGTDENGASVTDPNIALKGLATGTCALSPLGGVGEELSGYKCYGWATVVEVLSAALQGLFF